MKWLTINLSLAIMRTWDLKIRRSVMPQKHSGELNQKRNARHQREMGNLVVDQEKEKWLPVHVKEMKHLYSISNFGRVRSEIRTKEMADEVEEKIKQIFTDELDLKVKNKIIKHLGLSDLLEKSNRLIKN